MLWKALTPAPRPSRRNPRWRRFGSTTKSRFFPPAKDYDCVLLTSNAKTSKYSSKNVPKISFLVKSYFIFEIFNLGLAFVFRMVFSQCQEPLNFSITNYNKFLIPAWDYFFKYWLILTCVRQKFKQQLLL